MIDFSLDFYLILWAVAPPLLLLFYYIRRVPTAPSLLRLLLFFTFGVISGFVALGLESVFESQANLFVNWQEIERTAMGVVLHQLVEIAPIEEGCKFLAVFVPTFYFRRKYRLRPSTIFLFTLAVAFGFTAEENYIYLDNGTASIFTRIIGLPVHAMFSAPWGYALGISRKYRWLITKAWVNSVICHATVNILSDEWRYPVPLHFLAYALFPFLLWMFWRLEQLLRRVQGKNPINLISRHTSKLLYWQYLGVLSALMLGGNGIFGLFILVNTLSTLSFPQIFYLPALQFILGHLVLNLIFGLVAWVIYRHLRFS